MKKVITSLKELEKEQKKTEILMEMSKRQFLDSLSANQKHVKSYLVKRVVVPVGAVGLGAAVAKKITDGRDDATVTETIVKVEEEENFFSELFEVLLELTQLYFLKKQNDKVSELDAIQEGQINIQ